VLILSIQFQNIEKELNDLLAIATFQKLRKFILRGNNMITLTNNLNEQLFADLTPEEAAIVKGGATLYIKRIHAVRLTTDDRFSGKDEPYIRVDGIKVWGPTGINQGEILGVYQYHAVGRYSTIQLWEDDLRYDDRMGTLGLFRAGIGFDKLATFKGKGGEYRIRYDFY
jgi:hypothetical protein